MEEHVPFPDDPMHGMMVFEEDGVSDIRPGCILRVMEDGETVHSYELLSVRETGCGLFYDGTKEEIVELPEDDVESLLKRDETYVWSILTRAQVPINDDPVDTLVLSYYAIESPAMPSIRPIVFEWSITSQRPVKDMPDTDGLLMAPRFEQLRESVTTGNPPDDVTQARGDISELLDTLDGDIEEVLDRGSVEAEYNARALFNVNTPKTYGEETERRLERESEPLEEVVDRSNKSYV